MTLDDVLYSIRFKGRPGQSSLVDVRELIFNSGNTSLSGGVVTVALPRPLTGFVRRWASLVCQPSATAAGDKVFLMRTASDGTLQSALMDVELNGSIGSVNIPLITSGLVFSPTNSIFMRGVEPLYHGNESILNVIFQPAAPVAQTMNVSGWYKDTPF